MNSKQTFKTLRVTGLAALVAAAALATTALEARPGRRHDPERRLQRMKRHLDLSADQVAKIRAIHKKYRPQHKALRKQMRASKRAVRKLMAEGNVSRSDVKSKFQALAELKVKKRMLWFDQHREIVGILNQAQRTKLKQHMKKRMERKRKHRRKHKRGRRHRGCD